MNSAQFRLCRAVCHLDRIPRYGRLYRYDGDPSGLRVRSKWTKQWRYQRNGRWGMNLLIHWGLFWRFVDENERRYDLRRALQETALQETVERAAQVQRRHESLGLAAIGLLLLLSILALVLTWRGL